VEQLTKNTLDNIVRITQDTASMVSCTNHVVTSSRFQSYAVTLQAMIPTMITTTIPPPNAWKRHRPPVHVNLTDDTFPALDPNKKTKTSETVTMEPTNSMDDTPSFRMVELDEIDAKREALRSEMRTELDKMKQ
jgi:hypothetical protein